MHCGSCLQSGFLALVAMFAGGEDRKPQEKPFDDAEFVKMAASSGIAEVELGKLAMTQAKNDAVKKLAETLVTDHTKANEALKKAATDAGLTVPDKPNEEHQKHLDMFKNYKGENFDRDYVTHMIAGHEKGSDLYKRASKEAKNAQIKDFAAKTLPVVLAHLEAARKIEVR
jgi:putative membrane protein